MKDLPPDFSGYELLAPVVILVIWMLEKVLNVFGYTLNETGDDEDDEDDKKSKKSSSFFIQNSLHF